ncbi:BrnA antitoxin family protein [Profundibacter sp.]
MLKAEHMKDPHPIEQPEGRKATKNDLRFLQAASETLMKLHMQVYGREIMSLHAPEEWADLEQTFRCAPKKVRVTLLLDAPVAKFFRMKGRGYQALVNQVLRAYAELRLARVLEGPEDRGPSGEAL